MGVVVAASATGAPGVTTATLGLALTWPRDVVLADCDRAPSQTVLSGFLRGTDPGGRGLNALAKAHREQEDLRDELPRQLLSLTLEDAPRRNFLSGFTHPGSALLFHPVWPELVSAFEAWGDEGRDVIVDAGRLGADGLANALVSQADVVLLVVRSTLRSLAATRLYLPGLNDQLSALPGQPRVGLLVVGPDRPYSNREIERTFSLPVWGDVAWDSADAEVLCEGATQPRRFADRPLMRSLRAVASSTYSRLEERERQIAGTDSQRRFGLFAGARND